MERNTKKLLVGSIFIAVLLFLLAAFVFMFKEDPTCEDGIQNQNESGIDCGGPCFPCPERPVLKDLEVISTEWVFDIENRYDIAFKLKNPNSLYGLAEFQYRAIIYGADGQIMDQTSIQDGFILPGEEKYLLVQAVPLGSAPVDVKIEFSPISDEAWQKFTDYEEPNLVINNKHYEELSGGVAGFSRVAGTLINSSQYDFENILVKVVLRDSNGNLLAMNHQQMSTVRAREQRDFNMIFPHSFPGKVTQVEVEPEVNVFDSANFIQIKGNPRQWDAQ